MGRPDEKDIDQNNPDEETNIPNDYPIPTENPQPDPVNIPVQEPENSPIPGSPQIVPVKEPVKNPKIIL